MPLPGQAANMKLTARLFSSILTGMDTGCPRITGWISARPFRVRKQKSLKGAGISRSIIYTEGKIHIVSVSSRIPTIRPKRRHCNTRCFAGCPLSRTILNFRAMKGYIITAFLLSALFYSCKKIVTLKLNTAPSQIVIQGAVTNAAGPYTVAINQSVGFYADNSFPPVSGAIVVISDDQGVADSLTETS